MRPLKPHPTFLILFQRVQFGGRQASKQASKGGLPCMPGTSSMVFARSPCILPDQLQPPAGENRLNLSRRTLQGLGIGNGEPSRRTPSSNFDGLLLVPCQPAVITANQGRGAGQRNPQRSRGQSGGIDALAPLIGCSWLCAPPAALHQVACLSRATCAATANPAGEALS